MTVQNKYTDANIQAGKMSTSALSAGAKTLSVLQSFEVLDTDDDGSVYRIASLPASSRVLSITIDTDSLVGGTDWDVGIYSSGLQGDVKAQSVFVFQLKSF